MTVYWTNPPLATLTGTEIIGPVYQSGVNGTVTVRQIAQHFSPTFSPRDYGAVLDGVTDDSAAFQACFNAIAASAGGGCLEVAGTAYINTPLTCTIAYGQVLGIRSQHAHGLKFVFGSGISGGVGLKVTLTQATGGVRQNAWNGQAVHVENVDFVCNYTGVSGTALYVSPGANTGGTLLVQANNSVLIQNVTVSSAVATGWFATGIEIFALTSTKVDNVWFDLMLAGSCGIVYDTDTRIAVDHALFNVGGYGTGGTGIRLGYLGTTGGELQGFTIYNPQFTGITYGIYEAVTTGFDGLQIIGGQISTTNTGVFVQNAMDVVISGVQFLACGSGVATGYAIYIIGAARIVINGNAFNAQGVTTCRAIYAYADVDSYYGSFIITGNTLSWFAIAPIEFDGGTPTQAAFINNNQFETTSTTIPLVLDNNSPSDNYMGVNYTNGELRAGSGVHFQSAVTTPNLNMGGTDSTTAAIRAYTQGVYTGNAQVQIVMRGGSSTINSGTLEIGGTAQFDNIPIFTNNATFGNTSNQSYALNFITQPGTAALGTGNPQVSIVANGGTTGVSNSGVLTLNAADVVSTSPLLQFQPYASMTAQFYTVSSATQPQAQMVISGGTAGVVNSGTVELSSSKVSIDGYLVPQASGSSAVITGGTGVPGGTFPVGSLYLRNDGGSGARLYVSAGGGTWNAVAGV